VFTEDSVWKLSRILQFSVYTLGRWFLLKCFSTSDLGNCVHISYYHVPHFVGRVTVGTGWTCLGSNPVGTNFPPIKTGPGIHPAYSTKGTWSIPGGKVRQGRVFDNLPPSIASVMEENTAIPLDTPVR